MITWSKPALEECQGWYTVDSQLQVTHNRYTWFLSKYFFADLLFFFIWICIACRLESDKLAPFPLFANCSTRRRLRFSIRILEESNSCQEKRLQNPWVHVPFYWTQLGRSGGKSFLLPLTFVFLVGIFPTVSSTKQVVISLVFITVLIIHTHKDNMVPSFEKQAFSLLFSF